MMLILSKFSIQNFVFLPWRWSSFSLFYSFKVSDLNRLLFLVVCVTLKSRVGFEVELGRKETFPGISNIGKEKGERVVKTSGYRRRGIWGKNCTLDGERRLMFPLCCEPGKQKDAQMQRTPCILGDWSWASWGQSFHSEMPRNIRPYPVHFCPKICAKTPTSFSVEK